MATSASWTGKLLPTYLWDRLVPELLAKPTRHSPPRQPRSLSVSRIKSRARRSYSLKPRRFPPLTLTKRVADEEDKRPDPLIGQLRARAQPVAEQVFLPKCLARFDDGGRERL